MRVYVGTYGKYNNGSIAGEWVELSKFDSKKEFYEYCAKLHKDEEDPEYMFQDWEGIPGGYHSDLIGESWISEDIFEDGDREKLADSFASKLLMPEESLKQRIDVMADEHGGIRLEQLDDLAREFGVSLDAMVYRISSLYRIKKEDTERYLLAAKQLVKLHTPRESEEPEALPERYCDLAQRALRNGRLSLIQFAKYMGISYKKAREYLTDDEDFTDEEISISIA